MVLGHAQDTYNVCFVQGAELCTLCRGIGVLGNYDSFCILSSTWRVFMPISPEVNAQSCVEKTFFFNLEIAASVRTVVSKLPC